MPERAIAGDGGGADGDWSAQPINVLVTVVTIPSKASRESECRVMGGPDPIVDAHGRASASGGDRSRADLLAFHEPRTSASSLQSLQVRSLSISSVTTELTSLPWHVTRHHGRSRFAHDQRCHVDGRSARSMHSDWPSLAANRRDNDCRKGGRRRLRVWCARAITPAPHAPRCATPPPRSPTPRAAARRVARRRRARACRAPHARVRVRASPV